jgi:polysaccharide pyruvyl transferase WcaK-like protein
MKKILVYGFYFKGNIGDNLFIEAFQHIFPDIEFVFTDHIDLVSLDNIDVVFFGGGSFLLDEPYITAPALQKLYLKKIFYLGVGVEAKINFMHLDLMSKSVMIATRSLDQIDSLKLINKNVIYLPDLIYSLQSKVKLSSKLNRSVLIMPNISVVPRGSDPHWKHSAWNYFKSEFAQFLDFLIDEEFNINLFPMCKGISLDDDWASAELVSHMNDRSCFYIHPTCNRPENIEEVTALISKYDVVITQRFHGIVLAQMTKVPCLSISHHDKIKSEHSISYYGVSKDKLIEKFEYIKDSQVNISVDPATFLAFNKQVVSLL